MVAQQSVPAVRQHPGTWPITNTEMTDMRIVVRTAARIAGRLAHWALPPTGVHRAGGGPRPRPRPHTQAQAQAQVPRAHPEAPAPSRPAPRPLSSWRQAVDDLIDGDSIAMVRPFVLLAEARSPQGVLR